MALGTTLANLVIMVRDEARLSSSTSQGIDHLAYIKRLLKRTHAMLCDSYEWEHLRLTRAMSSTPLVANQQFYLFPSNLNTDRPFVGYLNLSGLWSRLAPVISPENYNAIDSYNGGRGDPLAWAWNAVTTRRTGVLVTATLSANTFYSGDKFYGSFDQGVTFADITDAVSGGTTISWFVDNRVPFGTSDIRFTLITSAGVVHDSPTTTGLAITNYNESSVGGFEVWPVPAFAAKLITGTLPAPLNAGDVFYGSLDSGATWTLITDTLSGLAMSWVAAPANLTTVQFQKISALGVTTAITMTRLTLTVTDTINFEGTKVPTSLLLDTDRADIDDILLSLQVAGEILAGNNQELAAKTVMAAANMRLSQIRASKSNASRIVIGGSPVNTGRRPRHPDYVTAR